MAALESASSRQEIKPFAGFIAKEMDTALCEECPKLKPDPTLFLKFDGVSGSVDKA